MKTSRSWIFYAALLIVFWGVWGAFSALPASKYGYPDEMIYCIWALTMIIPAVVILRGQQFDRRPAAAVYGLLIGLTGAGGQLLLFQALTMGPAYLIFPIVSISPTRFICSPRRRLGASPSLRSMARSASVRRVARSAAK